MNKRVIIFDIDGTLSNSSHRAHKYKNKEIDWTQFEDAAEQDDPHDEILYLNHLLADDKNNIILCVTGREESMRDSTRRWLIKHGVVFRKLYMRPSKDYRQDDIVKKEILAEIIVEFGKPFMIFEDRDRVVDMWRSLGYKCLQVEPGDF